MKAVKRTFNVGKMLSRIQRPGPSRDQQNLTDPRRGVTNEWHNQASPRQSTSRRVVIHSRHSEGSPEDTITKAICQFCDRSRSSSTSDDEGVALLPTIVDIAESSPSAAAEAARVLRKMLMCGYNKQDNTQQFQALMLVRILADNPGLSFTRNMDKKFVGAMQTLLRNSKDPSVLREAWELLDLLERKPYDANLVPLITMWRAEKSPPHANYNTGMQFPPPLSAPPQQPPQVIRLPDPVELSNHIAEASSSAIVLEQTLAFTPSHELLTNELVKEFAERCQNASRMIQAFMACDNPPPDHSTMESLIDTNELLQTSLNQHRRAVLGAKKASDTVGFNESTGLPRGQDVGASSINQLGSGVHMAYAGGSGGGSNSALHQNHAGIEYNNRVNASGSNGGGTYAGASGSGNSSASRMSLPSTSAPIFVPSTLTTGNGNGNGNSKGKGVAPISPNGSPLMSQPEVDMHDSQTYDGRNPFVDPDVNESHGHTSGRRSDILRDGLNDQEREDRHRSRGKRPVRDLEEFAYENNTYTR